MAKVENKILNLNIFDNNETMHLHPEGSITGENISSTLRDMIVIPNWNIRDFATERWKFKTQSSAGSSLSPYGEPGMFFYKVMFNFNTSYGLLGGLIKEMNGAPIKDINTAWQFLANNSKSSRFSPVYRRILQTKAGYLFKFAQLLNFLSNECPWFFKDVEGLATALNYDFSELVPAKGRTIKLTFNQDAVDMRVSTLIDLYKQACYDWVNFKEIIPENLRKFDMCIMLFNPPIAGMNFGGFITQDDMKYPKNNPVTASYKGFTGNNSIDSVSGMSFKCIYLKNCEILINELESITGNLNNEQGFKQELSMTIKFERHYSYNINKEFGLMISDSGFIENDAPIDPQPIVNMPILLDLPDDTSFMDDLIDPFEEPVYDKVIIPDYIEVVEEEVEEEELPEYIAPGV